MIVGTMNHPHRDLFEEMQWMADMGLEFIDMTLEPPEVPSWKADVDKIRAALERHRFKVVGHTPFYLPIASAIEEVRRGAVAELQQRRRGEVSGRACADDRDVVRTHFRASCPARTAREWAGAAQSGSVA